MDITTIATIFESKSTTTVAQNSICPPDGVTVGLGDFGVWGSSGALRIPYHTSNYYLFIWRNTGMYSNDCDIFGFRYMKQYD